MALAYDQQTVVARASGVNTLAMSSGQAIDAGDLVVVCSAIYNTSGNAISVTDNQGQTYEQAAAIVEGGGSSGGHVYIHAQEGHPGGTTTITIDPTGSSADINFTVSEVSGAATTSALDKTATNSGFFTESAGFTGGVDTGTLAQSAEIIFMIGSHTAASKALTEDTGDSFALIGEDEDNATGQTYLAQYKIVASTTAVTVNYTGAAGGGGTTQEWYAALATFKEAAGGGGTTRGTAFGHRGNALNGGRIFNGILQRAAQLIHFAGLLVPRGRGVS